VPDSKSGDIMRREFLTEEQVLRGVIKYLSNLKKDTTLMKPSIINVELDDGEVIELYGRDIIYNAKRFGYSVRRRFGGRYTIKVDSKKVIISRHKATIEWLQSKFGNDIPVIEHLSDPEMIRNKIVIGNIPIHLAVNAKEVWNVSIDLPPELRGKDLREEQFLKLNPRIEKYKVIRLDEVE